MTRPWKTFLALVVLASLAVVSGFGYTQYCSSASTRFFGVVVDPWAGWDAWTQEAGFAPSTPARFEHWSQKRTLDSHFAEARRKGLRSYFVTWEPWDPAPYGASVEEQSELQPDWSATTIVAGNHDEYIRVFARSVKFSQLKVFIRFAHEMNGNWYPWSNDSSRYVEAWRHVHQIFEKEGVENVFFVFAPNLNLYEDQDAWKEGVEKYWPGSDYVDYVGATVIWRNDELSAADFSQLSTRVQWLRERFNRPFIFAEVNTFKKAAPDFFSFLGDYVEANLWIEGVVLSQTPSRSDERLDWSALNDAETLIKLTRINDYLSPPTVCRLL